MTPAETGPENAEKRRQIDKLYRRSKRLFPRVPDLSVEELRELQAAGPVVLLDVRNPPEQEISMLPGAVTVQQFEAEPERYRARKIVAYCTVGHRSGLYTQRLLDHGFDAYNLRGAVLAWTHAGGELVNQEGATQRVHVAGRKWNLAASDYEGVW